MGLFVILGGLFYISPILSVLCCFMLLFTQSKRNTSNIFIVFFYLGLFLGNLNSLKVPESDLVYYIEIFTDCGGKSFFDYITSFGREPLFMIFNYVIYHLTFGDVDMYIIIFTLINYLLIFTSILLVHKKVKLSHKLFALSICIAFLFPNLFALSAHLMRQFLAASIILVMISYNLFFNKKRLDLLISAILVHTTSIFFVILYLPLLKKRISNYKILIITLFFGGGLLMVYNNSSILSSVFSGVPLLSYLISRIDGINQGWTTDNLTIISFVLQIFVVLVFYKLYKDNKSKVINYQKLYILSLILFVFVAINFNNTEIALRFSFYMYFLFPLAIYFLPSILFTKKRIVLFTKIYSPFVLLMFIVWFVYKLFNGTWIFENIESLIL